MINIRKKYRVIHKYITNLLYPSKVNRTSVLPDHHVQDRILLYNEKSITMPDDGNGSLDIRVNKKEVRILANVVFWPSMSIVQVNKSTLDIESELDDARFKKILIRKHARSYPINSMKGYVTSIDCAPGWRNYYHWFGESLPRVWGLHNDSVKKYGRITLLTARNFRAEEWGILQSLLPSNVEVKKVENNLRVKSDYIHLPILSERGISYLPKDYLEFYRRKVFDYFGLNIAKKPSKKLYISREKVGRRRFDNEEKVTEILKKNGYEKHTMDGLSIGEQVALFSSASHIIASHGAALTNLFYASKEASVIEVHHSKSDPRRSDYYRTLAFSRGMNYKSIWLDEATKNDNATLPLNTLVDALSSQY